VIDLHCHILPDVDDGPKTIEESLLMAKIAYEEGIRVIVATPHHRNGFYSNEKMDVLQYVSILNQRLAKEGINLTILPGSEIHIYEDYISDLKNGKLLTINNKDKYVLLELPNDRVSLGVEKLIFDIQIAGFIPIIPHPEKNRYLRHNPNLLYQFVKSGALTQLTSSSILGYMGKKVQSFSEEIIKHNLAHLVASNKHGLSKQGANLKEAYERIQKRFGNEKVAYYQLNAKKVVKGELFYIEPPRKIERKKSIFSFSKIAKN